MDKNSIDNLKNYDSKSIDKGIDLDTEYTKDLDHAEELTDVLLSMQYETERKHEMEKDATLKARKIHEEIVFHKGQKYQSIVHGVSSVFADGGVNIEIPDNVNLRNKEDSLDYLISKCLRFDYSSKEAVCQIVSDGIFDILNLEEDKRPVLMLVASINGRVSKYGNSTSINDDRGKIGQFREPGERFFHQDHKAMENGIIRINLPNFDNEPDIRDILATLEHECFHAYQFNCRRMVMPIKTVRDRVMVAAYDYGHNQYVSSKNDFEGYYEQGYESSARNFSYQLTQATDIIVRDAIVQIIKGDANA